MTEVITLQSLIERRNRGELTLDEFVEAVSEFAVEMENDALAQAVATFDREAEGDIDDAEENFEATVAMIAEGMIGPQALAIDIAASYPNAVTPLQISQYSQLYLKDFSSTLVWQYPRKIGTVNIGTAGAPVWEARYEMITHTVNPAIIAAEFRMFKNALKAGGGISQPGVFNVNFWNVTLQTPSANYAAVITINNPVSLNIDWGDGTVTNNSGTHTYAAAGTYTIKLSGKMAPNGNIRFTPLGVNLKATSVIDAGISDFTSTFQTCAGLTSLPAGIFDKCPNVTTFQNTFSGCTAVTGTMPLIFRFNPLVTLFAGCFNGCTGITGISAGLFDACPLATGFQSCFLNCAGIQAIPANLFINNQKAATFANCFQNCTGLTALPTLFTNTPSATTFASCFSGCSNIASAIPPTMMQNAPLVTSFGSCFINCTKLTGAAPTLWLTYPGATSAACFRNDTLLTNYAAIPAGWK